jgi:ADP-heptose:LPS heptosyltransferase
MDHVISVDTSTAHLAAALGRPVTVLLPFAPDWRWLLSRSDSPWYPTMHLLRQQSFNDWTPVLTQLSDIEV